MTKREQEIDDFIHRRTWGVVMGLMSPPVYRAEGPNDQRSPWFKTEKEAQNYVADRTIATALK